MQVEGGGDQMEDDQPVGGSNSAAALPLHERLCRMTVVGMCQHAEGNVAAVDPAELARPQQKAAKRRSAKTGAQKQAARVAPHNPRCGVSFEGLGPQITKIAKGARESDSVSRVCSLLTCVGSALRMLSHVWGTDPA